MAPGQESLSKSRAGSNAPWRSALSYSLPPGRKLASRIPSAGVRRRLHRFPQGIALARPQSTSHHLHSLGSARFVRGSISVMCGCCSLPRVMLGTEIPDSSSITSKKEGFEPFTVVHHPPRVKKQSLPVVTPIVEMRELALCTTPMQPLDSSNFVLEIVWRRHFTLLRGSRRLGCAC